MNLEEALRASCELADRCKALQADNDRLRELLATVLEGATRWVDNLGCIIAPEIPCVIEDEPGPESKEHA